MPFIVTPRHLALRAELYHQIGVLLAAGLPLIKALETLAEDYGADEVLVVNILYDHAARLRSYELLAQAFGLST